MNFDLGHFHVQHPNTMLQVCSVSSMHICIYMYTVYICVCAHAYICTFVYTRTLHVHMYMHAYKHTHINKDIYTYAPRHSFKNPSHFGPIQTPAWKQNRSEPWLRPNMSPELPPEPPGHRGASRGMPGRGLGPGGGARNGS